MRGKKDNKHNHSIEAPNNQEMIKQTLKGSPTYKAVDWIAEGRWDRWNWRQTRPKSVVEERQWPSMDEPSQEGDDACAQPRHSEHEDQDKRTEQ